MKNKYSLTEFSNLANGFQTLQKKIASDERKREKLIEQIGENPSVKLEKRLLRLDETIAVNKQKLPSPEFLQFVTGFDDFGNKMLRMIEKYDDKLLLTMGDGAPQWQVLQLVQERRNATHDAGAENVLEVVNGFDTIIEALRLNIEEKRTRAAEHFPELARQQRPPEYEMPAEYNEALNFITEQIERRDRAMKNFKFAPPEKHPEILGYIKEIDRLINEGEEHLARIYENHQKKQRYVDGMRNILKQGSKTELRELREHLKKKPTSDGVMERLLREEFPE